MPEPSWTLGSWNPRAVHKGRALGYKALACSSSFVRFSLVLCAPVMDCTLPSSSVAPRSPQQDEEQPDRWKYSQPWYHHNERSLSPGGRRCSNSRSEPLECRDLLVQNALFTGDLEMVQKYFTKSAAVNLVIETKGDELRWTSRKRGGCAGMGRGGDGECPGWGERNSIDA